MSDLNSGDNIQLIKNLLQKIRENRNSRQLYIDLGTELVKINMIDQALKSFKVANQLKEDYLSLYNLACLYYKKKDYKSSTMHLERSRQLNSDFVMTHILAGICYSRLNNFRAAEVNFINVLMNDPSNRTALTALSILYHNQGRTTESLNFINRLTNLYQPGKNVKNLKTHLIRESIKDNRTVKSTDTSGFQEYEKYIMSLPVDIYTDKYGTIQEKIKMLETRPDKNIKNLISLSLCHLFSGNAESALECLYAAKNCKAS